MRGGGGGGIRTHGGLTPTPVFKTGALNHSTTPPELAPARYIIPRASLDVGHPVLLWGPLAFRADKRYAGRTTRRPRRRSGLKALTARGLPRRVPNAAAATGKERTWDFAPVSQPVAQTARGRAHLRGRQSSCWNSRPRAARAAAIGFSRQRGRQRRRFVKVSLSLFCHRSGVVPTSSPASVFGQGVACATWVEGISCVA